MLHLHLTKGDSKAHQHKTVNQVLYPVTEKRSSTTVNARGCLGVQVVVHEPAWLVGTKLGNNAHGNFWEGIYL